jgi:hypothetical protein
MEQKIVDKLTKAQSIIKKLRETPGNIFYEQLARIHRAASEPMGLQQGEALSIALNAEASILGVVLKELEKSEQ